MKLNLNRKWYEDRINVEDDFDVTVGTNIDEADESTPSLRVAGHSEEEFAESFAFSTLIRLSRKERGLSVQQLAHDAGISVVEVISIEQDHDYRPKPRTIHQLAQFFEIAHGSLMMLANMTQVHDEAFLNETIRFAANAADFVNLGEHERQALHEYVHFLSKQNAVR